MAEWLRRWTWNPMGYPRAGSNPARSVNILQYLCNLSWSEQQCSGHLDHLQNGSRGNKCHLPWWRNIFSEKRLSPRFSAFGQWATQIWGDLEASITSSEILKRDPFIKLFNVRTSLFCSFEKRLTFNFEEIADRLKIFIRANYVLPTKFGWHLF